jgi:hypothetical protein
VYIFLVHGLDPLDFANLSGVRDHIVDLGFHKTYYGQFYHAGFFAKEIRRIHQEDPDARFVVIGFSLGASQARNICQRVKEDGIPIALLVYLDGNTLENTRADRPENAKQIVNILASGYVWNGAQLDGAINLNETDVYHFDAPTHKRTTHLLDDQLLTIAASVPRVEPANPAPMPESDTEPTPPRSPKQVPLVLRDEWNFLRPGPSWQPAANEEDAGRTQTLLLRENGSEK